MFESLSTRIRRWRVKIFKPFGQAGSDELRVTLGDLNPQIAAALAEAFNDAPAVEVIQGNLLELACDAIVSPANSFGDMGGGIDKAIDDFYDGAAQSAVRSAIAERFYGEVPVGTALIVKIPGRRFRFIVAAPTMRIPGNVAGTINAYLAMRAALVSVTLHNAAGGDRIGSMAIPGLCTGIGGMSAEESAEQMRTAYDAIVGGKWRMAVHPALSPYAMRSSS